MHTCAAVASSHFSLTIPKHELPAFHGLDLQCQQEVRARLRIMARLIEAKKVGRIGVAIAAEAPGLGLSTQSTRRLYDEFRKGIDDPKARGGRIFQPMDWRILINYAKFPDADDLGLPGEFVEWWQELCEERQRKCAPARRELLRAWRTRWIMRRGKKERLEAIPGYEEWPKAENGREYPRGWSEATLYRCKPSRFHLTANRVGRTAAQAHTPLVYTSRANLWVGSHYMVDDMWHDFFVNCFTEKQAGRPLELFSHDLYSARKVRWGVRVRTRKDDGSYNALTEKMTRYILAATLYQDGYSPRGTVMVGEHGTAAWNEEIEQAMREASGGLVTTQRSGMTGAVAHAGQYPGLSKGNFRMKASLESGNNFTHNEFDALPGQTGMDVAHRPEQLDGQLRNNAMLLAAYQQLPEQRRELLQFSLLELNQFMSVATEIYGNIENYTDHDLNDWIECGHVVNEFFFDGRWVDQRALLGQDEEMRAMFERGIESGTIKTRPRKMSRREAWDRQAGDLIKLPGYGVVAILGSDLAVERKVIDGQFVFEDAEVGPGYHRYFSTAFDPEGRRIELRDGETYQAFVNPFAPDALFVCNAKGGYIGECKRTTIPGREEVDAVQRACGAAAKRESDRLQPLRARHMAEAREKARRQGNNARVAGDAPVTPEEKQEARDQARTARATARFGSAVAASRNATSVAPATEAETPQPVIEETWHVTKDEPNPTLEETWTIPQ